MKIDGGCHCGRISYEAEVDPATVGLPLHRLPDPHRVGVSRHAPLRRSALPWVMHLGAVRSHPKQAV